MSQKLPTYSLFVSRFFLTRPLAGGSPQLQQGMPKASTPDCSLEDRSAVRHILVTSTCVFAVALLCLTFAVHCLRVHLAPYDDEGYMMSSLQSYLHGARLYTQTYTQYGPFFFFAQELFFRLAHLQVTHDTNRLVTLVYWMMAACFGSFFVYRLCRSALLACSAMAGCTVIGVVLAGEPGHPQQVIFVLLAASAFLSALIATRYQGLSLLLLGMIGSALLFTKINVGAFYVFALAQTIVCLLLRGQRRIIGVSFMALVSIALPYMLVSRTLGPFSAFCVTATASVTVTFLASALSKVRPGIPAGLLGWLLGGGLLAAGLILFRCRMVGISASSLVDGLLLEPAKHPLLFSAFMRPSRETLQIGFVLVLSTGMLMLTFLASRGVLARHLWLVGMVRWAAGILAVPMLLHGSVSWVLPLIPLTVIRVQEERRDWPAAFARIFLANLAVMQYLQAYPVAGSQRYIASLPVLLCAIVWISDGIDELSLLAGGAVSRRNALAWAAVAVIVIATAETWVEYVDRTARVPSGLRGSSILLLKPAAAEQLQYLANHVTTNCGMLFTMPGMGSFNFWSGVAPPNDSNMGAWMQYFSIERQAEILKLLRADSRACVIYNRRLVEFWEVPDRVMADLPLAQYILRDMVGVATRGDYEVRVQRWRPQPWIE